MLLLQFMVGLWWVWFLGYNLGVCVTAIRMLRVCFSHLVWQSIFFLVICLEMCYEY